MSFIVSLRDWPLPGKMPKEHIEWLLGTTIQSDCANFGTSKKSTKTKVTFLQSPIWKKNNASMILSARGVVPIS